MDEPRIGGVEFGRISPMAVRMSIFKLVQQKSIAGCVIISSGRGGPTNAMPKPAAEWHCFEGKK